MKKFGFVFIVIILFIIIVTLQLKNLQEPIQSEPIIREKIIVDIDPHKPVVALTFDDGPSKSTTNEILDILYKNKATATFFINGKNIQGNEFILKKIVGEGSELANHTYSHKNLTTLSATEIAYEIDETQRKVNEVLGEYKLFYVRPPYGVLDANVTRAINYPISLWSLDSDDWSSKDADIIYDTVLANVKDCDVIIMHDDYKASVEALRKIVPALKEKGYQFVTLSKLYEYRGDDLTPNTIYR